VFAGAGVEIVPALASISKPNFGFAEVLPITTVMLYNVPGVY
jgi:hypothetical protein